MPNVLKVAAIKLSTPVALVISFKPYDLSIHNLLQPYARIMMSSILNFVSALTA